jgi:hypothetical protein
MEWNQLAMLCWPAQETTMAGQDAFQIILFMYILYIFICCCCRPAACDAHQLREEKKKKKRQKKKKNFFFLFTKEGNIRIIVITTLNHLFDG